MLLPKRHRQRRNLPQILNFSFFISQNGRKAFGAFPGFRDECVWIIV